MTSANKKLSFRCHPSLAMGLASVGLVLFAFSRALTELWKAWQSEEYSHGSLLPALALIMGWHLLTEKKSVRAPSWLGLAGLALAALLLFFGAFSAFVMMEEYGLIVALAALCLAFMGRGATKILLPALVYLVFAVPLPHLIRTGLSQDLQLLSSTLGVWPLSLLGFSVYQEGNMIDLGGLKLQVVDACSGLRYLFPLMSFGYLVAFLMEDRFYKKATLFLSTIPITIFMNALRISIIGVTVEFWGPSMAEGLLHDFEGWTVFVGCTALLLLELWGLEKLGVGGRFRSERLALPSGALFSKERKGFAPELATLLAAALLAGLFGSGQLDARDEVTPSHPPFALFPTELGDWRGQIDRIDSAMLDELKLSDYWNADYKRAEDSSAVNLYLAFYASQRVGVMTHSPADCIPSGGWHIEGKTTQSLTLEDGKTLRITRMQVKRGEARALVYYWFDERGRNLTETIEAKIYLFWDSLVHRRSDGTLVRLVAKVAPGEEVGAADARLKAFLLRAYPAIKAVVPPAAF